MATSRLNSRGSHFVAAQGFEVRHETVRTWEFRFAPLLSEQLRAKRCGAVGASWYLSASSRRRRRKPLRETRLRHRRDPEI